jgi:hypothetical protein
MKLMSTLLLTLCTAILLAAQSGASDPFLGTWKLDVSKSKFDPGPPLQSETVSIGRDGKVEVQNTGANGQNEDWSYMYVQDQEVPITGMDNSSVKESRHNNRIEHTWKFNGQNYTGKAVISKDGKTMTYTLDGTMQDGKHEHDVMVFEKQ